MSITIQKIDGLIPASSTIVKLKKTFFIKIKKNQKGLIVFKMVSRLKRGKQIERYNFGWNGGMSHIL